jgi:hypothetical protein
MKTSKEQLIADLALAGNKVNDNHDLDEFRRQEFAKAFGWFKKRGTYDYGEVEPLTPTWYEIMVQIGKLLTAQKGLIYVIDIEALKLDLQEMRIRFEELKRKQDESNLGRNN